MKILKKSFQRNKAGLLFRYLAIMLFVALPIVGFWLGTKNTSPKSPNKHNCDPYNEIVPKGYKLYRGQSFNFYFQYPDHLSGPKIGVSSTKPDPYASEYVFFDAFNKVNREIFLDVAMNEVGRGGIIAGIGHEIVWTHSYNYGEYKLILNEYQITENLEESPTYVKGSRMVEGSLTKNDIEKVYMKNNNPLSESDVKQIEADMIYIAKTFRSCE